MRATTKLTARATEQHQDGTHDKQDDAEGPKDIDTQNSTKDQKNNSQTNHAVEVPGFEGIQTSKWSMEKRDKSL
jgi:hypothetical protein